MLRARLTPARRAALLWRAATAPLRSLPDFLIIGAQKGGTTTLYETLCRHPNVAKASRKEVHYFEGRDYRRGTMWYRAHFPTAIYRSFSGRRLTGEATPLMHHVRPPQRIAALMPHVKLIALLRNPVDRAFSHYHKNVRRGAESLSFEDAIAAEPKRLEGELERTVADEDYTSDAYSVFSYLARGVYVDQLRRWLEWFPREQLLVLKSEDFFADPARTYGQVLEFLGLPGVPLQLETRNVGGYGDDLSPATRAALAAYFRPHNQRLYELLGRDLGWDEPLHPG